MPQAYAATARSAAWLQATGTRCVTRARRRPHKANRCLRRRGCARTGSDDRSWAAPTGRRLIGQAWRRDGCTHRKAAAASPTCAGPERSHRRVSGTARRSGSSITCSMQQAAHDAALISTARGSGFSITSLAMSRGGNMNSVPTVEWQSCRTSNLHGSTPRGQHGWAYPTGRRVQGVRCYGVIMLQATRTLHVGTPREKRRSGGRRPRGVAGLSARRRTAPRGRAARTAPAHAPPRRRRRACARGRGALPPCRAYRRCSQGKERAGPRCQGEPSAAAAG